MEIKLEGLDEAIQKLGKIAGAETAGKALHRFAEELKLRVIPYPPEGPWNTPGPYPSRWYQRHFGPRWTVKSGEVHGRDTSERMQKQWVVEQRGALAYILGNRASYADLVVGENQLPMHAAHGWKKVEDIAMENINLWPEILKEEIEKALGG